MTTTLIHDLDQLHAAFVTRVNEAVAADDMDRVATLAAEYDEQAIRLVAEREGRLDMLPLQRRGERDADTRMQRLVRRLRLQRAA